LPPRQDAVRHTGKERNYTKAWLLKIVLVWLSIPGYLRASMLVVLVGVFSDNPIGLGFLFALVTPIALLLIVSGTILALVTDGTSDTR